MPVVRQHRDARRRRLSVYGGLTVLTAKPPENDEPLRYSQIVSLPVGPMK